MTGLRGVAAWTGPVLVGVLAARVCAGDAQAPLLLAVAVVAPLLALLQPPAPPSAAHVATATAAGVAATFVLCANVLVLAEVASSLGGRRWQGSVVAGGLALLVTLSRTVGRWHGVLLAAGAAALLVPAALVGVTSGGAPWTAWREAAQRPALAFGARSTWVTDGGSFTRRTTLAFSEGHRVVAVTAGTLRVLEREPTGDVLRDWPLAAGDALTLRPGDRLTVEPGSRLRFEAGKRVPGAAASGPAWADGQTRRRPSDWLGPLATLVLGALALVPTAGRGARFAPAVVVALALGSACWGLYAVARAPDVALAGSLAEPWLLLPLAVAGPRGVPLAALVAAGLLALFLATAGALRERVSVSGAGPSAWLAMVAVAAGASLWPLDPWIVLAGGLGVAAAAIGAPRLAGAAGVRIGGQPMEAVGAIAGGLAFAAFAVLGPHLPAVLSPAAEWPALLAAPLAWLVVRMARHAGARPAG